MRIRKFNESFDSDHYLDCLLSEVEEKNISFKDNGDFFLYVEYDISTGQADRIDNYIKLNPRFNDVITISKYDFDTNYHRILLVDRFFYSRNQNCLYKNIKWDKHPIRVSLKKSGVLTSSFSKAEKAIDIPESVSIIRNLDRVGQVEIWNPSIMEDPIRVWEDDTPLLQYLLFKYLAK